MTTRRNSTGRRLAALGAALVVACAGGCAGWRYKLPGAEAAAKCRDYARRGVCAMETGDWGEAEQLLRQAVDASPVDADSRWRLAETLWTRGERDEAIEHMRSAVELEPQNEVAAVRLGEMLMAVGREAEAIEQAKQALALDPQSPQAWALRGRGHWRRGDTDQALADLQQSLRHNPDARDVLADVAWLYRELGRRRRELTTLHILRDTYLPGEEPIELLAGEADAYLALGRAKPAVERLRLACGRATPSAALLYRLAEAEAAAGAPALARVAAERALGMDAAHEPARQLLAKLDAAPLR